MNRNLYDDILRMINTEITRFKQDEVSSVNRYPITELKGIFDDTATQEVSNGGVVVTPPLVVYSLIVDPVSEIVTAGNNAPYSVKKIGSDGSIIDVTDRCVYTYDNTQFSGVVENGSFIAKTNLTSVENWYTIKADCDGLSVSARLYIQSPSSVDPPPTDPDPPPIVDPPTPPNVDPPIIVVPPSDGDNWTGPKGDGGIEKEPIPYDMRDYENFDYDLIYNDEEEIIGVTSNNKKVKYEFVYDDYGDIIGVKVTTPLEKFFIALEYDKYTMEGTNNGQPYVEEKGKFIGATLVDSDLNPYMQAIVIQPPTARVPNTLGSYKYECIGVTYGGKAKNITDKVTWTVDSPLNISKGLVGGFQGLSGTYNLHAVYQHRQTNATIKIVDFNIIITPASMSVDIGTSVPHTATVVFDDGVVEPITSGWQTTDYQIDSLGTLSNTDHAGTAIVSVGAYGKIATATVEVKDPIPPIDQLLMSPDYTITPPGMTIRFDPVIIFGGNQALTIQNSSVPYPYNARYGFRFEIRGVSGVSVTSDGVINTTGLTPGTNFWLDGVLYEKSNPSVTSYVGSARISIVDPTPIDPPIDPPVDPPIQPPIIDPPSDWVLEISPVKSEVVVNNNQIYKISKVVNGVSTDVSSLVTHQIDDPTMAWYQGSATAVTYLDTPVGWKTITVSYEGKSAIAQLYVKASSSDVPTDPPPIIPPTNPTDPPTIPPDDPTIPDPPADPVVTSIYIEPVNNVVTVDNPDGLYPQYILWANMSDGSQVNITQNELTTWDVNNDNFVLDVGYDILTIEDTRTIGDCTLYANYNGMTAQTKVTVVTGTFYMHNLDTMKLSIAGEIGDKVNITRDGVPINSTPITLNGTWQNFLVPLYDGNNILRVERVSDSAGNGIDFDLKISDSSGVTKFIPTNYHMKGSFNSFNFIKDDTVFPDYLGEYVGLTGWENYDPATQPHTTTLATPKITIPEKKSGTHPKKVVNNPTSTNRTKQVAKPKKTVAARKPKSVTGHKKIIPGSIKMAVDRSNSPTPAPTKVKKWSNLRVFLDDYKIDKYTETEMHITAVCSLDKKTYKFDSGDSGISITFSDSTMWAHTPFQGMSILHAGYPPRGKHWIKVNFNVNGCVLSSTVNLTITDPYSIIDNITNFFD